MLVARAWPGMISPLLTSGVTRRESFSTAHVAKVCAARLRGRCRFRRCRCRSSGACDCGEHLSINMPSLRDFGANADRVNRFRIARLRQGFGSTGGRVVTRNSDVVVVAAERRRTWISDLRFEISKEIQRRRSQYIGNTYGSGHG